MDSLTTSAGALGPEPADAGASAAPAGVPRERSRSPRVHAASESEDSEGSTEEWQIRNAVLRNQYRGPRRWPWPPRLHSCECRPQQVPGTPEQILLANRGASLIGMLLASWPYRPRGLLLPTWQWLCGEQVLSRLRLISRSWRAFIDELFMRPLTVAPATPATSSSQAA